MLTARIAQVDNAPLANILEKESQPGDIIVVDAGGLSRAAAVGGITANFAEKTMQLNGILIYGAIRDQDELAALPIPVFGLGCSPNGPTKRRPGMANAYLTLLVQPCVLAT